LFTDGSLGDSLFGLEASNITSRVLTVRESQGILSESEKVRENREGLGKVREF